MTRATQTPEGQVADAVSGNWVDRYAPEAARPYLRLSRADRPIGTWLLLLPCWWSLLLAMLYDATPAWSDLWIAIGCGAGAWLMRGAGCTWNDITDRRIDASVARTRSRPIPSGQVTVRGALIWMAAQALIAFGILLTFPPAAVILGVLSLVKKHGFQLIDECCVTALEIGAPRYRTVRKLAERRPQSPPLRQFDELIRDLTHYRQIIDDHP